MRIENRKKFTRAMILLFMVILIAVKSADFLGGKVTGDKNNVLPSSNIVDEEVLKGKTLNLDSKGSVFFEESQYFKKYSIVLGESKDHVNYNQNKGYLFLDIKETSKLSLNSESFKETDKDIILTEINGKTVLAIRKKFEGNNYVLLDEMNNKLIILISKEDKPFKRTVVLDPGHGGVDPGAPAYDNSFDEKTVTLKIQKAIRPELIFNGCEVFMSRDEDKTIRIEDVVAFTEEKKADVFVSVHINSYEKSKAYNGIETYYCKSNAKVEESKKLAEKIQQNAVKSDGWKNRGVVTANFYVIKHNDMPAVLVECGFASNPADVDRLNDDKTLQNLAKNISNGILEYINEK